ncbi:MAG: hypothetical protein A2V88_04760 [Elusimicrobia bacterium RBG_16_66_12]|nr:MAG: hypothetical protein A2V88_04760 [Elusimicrobia bacterium RBG_16_66_12]
MRELSFVILIAAASALTACTATVQTYDSSERLIGSCKAHRWILGPAVTCSGRANGETQK